jgi:hypothetical protein
MMTSKFILLAGLFAIITAQFTSPQVTPTPATGERDPVKSFEKLAATFPTHGIRNSTKTGYSIENVTFDVKKTDSRNNPIIGVINFTTNETLPYPPTLQRVFLKHFMAPMFTQMQMEFHWQGDRWKFARIVSRKDGADATHSELWEAGPMADFVKSVQ